MLKQKIEWVTGKTEPTEKFRKLNQQKIHISSFLSVNGNEISALAIMKKLKNFVGASFDLHFNFISTLLQLNHFQIAEMQVKTK